MNFGAHERRTNGDGSPASNPSPVRNSSFSVRMKWLSFAGLLVLAAGVVFWYFPQEPFLAPPIPSDLNRLEPQLHAYVAEKIKWLLEDPQDPMRHATLGLVYAVNTLWPEARIAFQNAAALNPNEPLAHLYVAVATQELGEQDAVLGLYRQVTIRFPEFPPGFDRLGTALLKAGANGEAETAFKKLIAIAPKEWRGYSGLGEIELRRGEHANAAAQFRKALELEPAAQIVHHLLGLSLRGMGNMEEADRELRQGLDAVVYPMPDPWAASASQHMMLLQDQFEMANAYSKSGEPLKAIEILERARKYHPNHVSLLNNLAVAYHFASQPNRAHELAMRVIELDPKNLSGYVNLASSGISLNLTNEALKYADKAIEISPNTPHGFLSKANILLALEHDAEALEALKSALEFDPQNAQLQLEIGDVCLYNLSRPKEALGYFQRASQQNPTWPAALVSLADVHIRMGNTNEALASITAIEKLDSRDPSIPFLRERLSKLTSQ